MTALSSEFVFGFVDLLRWVRDRYEDAKDPGEKREWSIRELNILRRMAREIHPAVDREGLLAPLSDLVLSLFSLDYGVADPSLRPRKLKHRPPDPRWALFRGRAAAASELLRSGTGATASEGGFLGGDAAPPGGIPKSLARARIRIHVYDQRLAKGGARGTAR